MRRVIGDGIPDGSVFVRMSARRACGVCRGFGNVVYFDLHLMYQIVGRQDWLSRPECVVDIAVVADWSSGAGVGA